MTRPFRAPGDPKPKGPPVIVVLKPTLRQCLSLNPVALSHPSGQSGW